MRHTALRGVAEGIAVVLFVIIAASGAHLIGEMAGANGVFLEGAVGGAILGAYVYHRYQIVREVAA